MKRAKTMGFLAAVLALAFSMVAVAFAEVKPNSQATNPPAGQATIPASNQAPKKKMAMKAKAKAAAAANGAATGSQAAGAAPAAPGKAESAGKRDPFAPLINQHKEGGSDVHLPPGKAGLVVATVRVDGTIRSANGMIAMVSNPEQHEYFIREGDRLYDGDVEKIGLDGVTFRENSKDAFGKPIDRMVTKRIYASAGEQQ